MSSRDLLEDEDVRRWYENTARGSEMTAIERLRILARLCRLMETTPGAMIEAVHERGNGFEDRFQDFIEGQRNLGRVPSYLQNYLKTVRSWLDHHGLALSRRIKVGKTQATPTLTDEKVPTGEELRDLLMAAGPRDRAVVCLMAFSGLRPHVLGNFKGLDGLQVRDLSDLRTDGGRVSFARIPTAVRVRVELSKVDHEYFTFLGEEGCEHLQRYLQTRLDNGEELEAKSPVIRCAPGFEVFGKREDSKNRGSPFIVTGNIRRGVKKCLDKIRLDHRPYVLRRYFETQLFNASWKGLVPRDWITFWAGHKGDIEHVYTLHKGLPDGLIEEMREAYAKAEPYLSTVSLKPEGREIYATDVSSEKMQLTAPIPNPEWAGKTNEEKLLAFMVRAVQENDVLKAALRDALRE